MSLLEPFMLLVIIVSAIFAPYAAIHVFGATYGLSLHFAMATLGAWACGLVAIPLAFAALAGAIQVGFYVARPFKRSDRKD